MNKSEAKKYFVGGHKVGHPNLVNSMTKHLVEYLVKGERHSHLAEFADFWRVSEKSPFPYNNNWFVVGLAKGEVNLTKNKGESISSIDFGKGKDTMIVVPYQVCPLCNGAGYIFPMNVAFAAYSKCDICDGKKIIPMHIVSTKENKDA